jgi:HlyD family secretion protein
MMNNVQGGKTMVKRSGIVPRVIGVGLVLAVVGGLMFWRTRGRAAAEYATAPVERGTLRSTVTATGTLEAVRTVQVGSQVSGSIAKLYADFNSVARKGQLIAQIDPAMYQAQVEQARANLAAARAQRAEAKARLTNARNNIATQRAGLTGANANLAALRAQRDDARRQFERQASLAEEGIITPRDLDAARTNFDAAEARYNQAVAQVEQAKLAQEAAASGGIEQTRAQVQQAEAQVKQMEAALRVAEVNLERTTIVSPIDSVVISRAVDAGQTVAAQFQTPTLFTIARDLTQMQVIANIDQADIGSISSNNEVKFTVDAYPNQMFGGAIKQIRLNPQTVQNVATYNVVIEVENRELRLKPGLTANLVLTTAERANVLRVPNTALRFTPTDAPASPKGRVVWALDAQGKPVARSIATGITDGFTTEITGGELRQGEAVITGLKQAEAK